LQYQRLRGFCHGRGGFVLGSHGFQSRLRHFAGGVQRTYPRSSPTKNVVQSNQKIYYAENNPDNPHRKQNVLCFTLFVKLKKKEQRGQSEKEEVQNKNNGFQRI
jgi:hypothetical protein